METPRGPMAVMGPRGIRHWQQSTMGILAFSAEILHQKVQVSLGFGITGHLRGRCREVYQGDRKPKRRVLWPRQRSTFYRKPVNVLQSPTARGLPSANFCSRVNYGALSLG